jgi:iron complex outermembrane receptor protein
MSRKFSALAFAALASIASNPASAAGEKADDKPAPIPTIVVTASPIASDADFLATIVEKRNRDEILRSGGTSLADALSNVPGVTGTTHASGASRPVIRGFDANRVKTLQDGIGSFDVSDLGPDHGVPVDPLSAESIEVVRGAATLRYGSQAIGGVVNAITNRVPIELPKKSFEGDMAAIYGTNSDSKQGAAHLGGRAGQFALHADAFARKTSDYDTPQGAVPNSFFDGGGAALGSSYFFGADDRHRIGAAVVHYDSRYGIPGEDAHIDMQQTKQMLRSSFAIDRGALRTLTLDGGYADYEHSERDPDGAALATFKDREWDARLEAVFGPAGFLSGSAVGVQMQRKDFSALGEAEDFLLPTTTVSNAAFAFAEAPAGGDLRFQFGARIESVTVDGTPASDVATSRHFTPISASVGFLFESTPALRFGLTFSSAARPPAQTELYARGLHEATATFETGDPTLDEERANSLEGSIRVRTGRVRFDGSVWTAQFKDYIFGELTGRTCDENAACVNDDSLELDEVNYRALDASFRGAEAKVTFDLMETAPGELEAQLFADYVRATLDEGAGNVPRIPPYRLGAGISWTGSAFDGGVLVKYSGRQDRTAFAETETAGFTTVDAQLGWRPLASNPNFEFVLIGRNLTDRVQRNAVAWNKDEVILPGRDLRLLVRWEF